MVEFSKPLVVARIRPRKEAEVTGKKPKVVFASQEEGEEGAIKIFDQDPEEASSDEPALTFNVTACFDDEATNDEVYEKFADHFMSGFNNRINITLFAYGESGSGKTYTMSYIMRHFIAHMIDVQKPLHKKLAVKLSMVEIDNEKIYDLMAKKRGDPLKIVNYEVKGCILRVINQSSEIEPTLEEAWSRRKVEATEFNDVSSRSHAVSTVKIAATTMEGVSFDVCVHIIDLAGSEYTGKSAQQGNPNKSLSLLQLMVRDIVSGKKPQGFRSSKLTHLLQPSLMGQCKLGLVFTLNPCSARGAKATSTFAINTMKMPAAKVKQNACKMNQAQLQQASEALLAREIEARAEAEEERRKMMEVLKKNEKLEAELKALHDAHGQQTNENETLRKELVAEKEMQSADVRASAGALLVFLDGFKATLENSYKEIKAVKSAIGKKTLLPESQERLEALEEQVQVVEGLVSMLKSESVNHAELNDKLPLLNAAMAEIANLPTILQKIATDNNLSVPVGPASHALRKGKGKGGAVEKDDAANWTDMQAAADGQELKYIVDELKGKAAAAAGVEAEEAQLGMMIAAQEEEKEMLQKKLEQQQAEIEALKSGAGTVNPVKPSLELLEALMMDADSATTIEGINKAVKTRIENTEAALSLMPGGAEFQEELMAILKEKGYDPEAGGFVEMPTKTALKSGLAELNEKMEQVAADFAASRQDTIVIKPSMSEAESQHDKMLKRLIAAIPYQGSFEKIQVLFSLSKTYIERFHNLGGVDRICSECFSAERNSTWHAKAAQFIPHIKYGPSHQLFRERGALPFIANLLTLQGGPEEDIKRIYACRAVQSLTEDDAENKTFFVDKSTTAIIALINSQNQEVQEAAAAALSALAKESIDAKHAIVTAGGMTSILRCLALSNIYTQLAALKTVVRIIVGNPEAAEMLAKPLGDLGVPVPQGLDPAVGLAMLVQKASTNNRVLQNAAMQGIFNAVEDSPSNLELLRSICGSGRFPPITWEIMEQLLLRSVASTLLSAAAASEEDSIEDAYVMQKIDRLDAASIKYFGALGTGRWRANMAGGRDAASHMYYRNPQWTLEVTEAATFSIVLEKGQDRYAKKAFLQLDLYESDTAGNHEVNFKTIVADSGTAYEDRVTMQVKLEPKAYVIVVSHSVVGRPLDYNLAVVANAEFELDATPYMAGWNLGCSGTVGYGAWRGEWKGDANLTGPGFWRNPQYIISLDEDAIKADGQTKEEFLKSLGADVPEELLGDADEGSVNVIVDVHTLQDNTEDSSDNRIRIFAIKHNRFSDPKEGEKPDALRRYVGRIRQSKNDKQNHVEDSIYWTGTRKLRTAAVIRLQSTVVVSVALHDTSGKHPEQFAINVFSPWPITVTTVGDELSFAHMYDATVSWDLKGHQPTKLSLQTRDPLPDWARREGAIVPRHAVCAMAVVNKEDLAWCVRMNINAAKDDTDEGVPPGQLELVSLGAVGRHLRQGSQYALNIDPLGCDFKHREYHLMVFSDVPLTVEGAKDIAHKPFLEGIPQPSEEEVAMGEAHGEDEEVELDGMLSNQLLKQANDLIDTLKGKIRGMKMQEEFLKKQAEQKGKRISELESMQKGRSHEIAMNFLDKVRTGGLPKAEPKEDAAKKSADEKASQDVKKLESENARLKREKMEMGKKMFQLQEELAAIQAQAASGPAAPSAGSPGAPRRPGGRQRPPGKEVMNARQQSLAPIPNKKQLMEKSASLAKAPSKAEAAINAPVPTGPGQTPMAHRKPPPPQAPSTRRK